VEEEPPGGGGRDGHLMQLERELRPQIVKKKRGMEVECD